MNQNLKENSKSTVSVRRLHTRIFAEDNKEVTSHDYCLLTFSKIKQMKIECLIYIHLDVVVVPAVAKKECMSG